MSDFRGGDLQRYKDYAPTQFDRAGSFLDEDRQEWGVLPMIRTRDSGPWEESNFVSTERILTERAGEEGEENGWEIHRFGHWGPGWYEIIIVKPDTDAWLAGCGVAEGLADYPVVDEMDLSEREWEHANEVWNNCFNLAERVALCQEYGCSVFAARHDYIPRDDNGGLYDYLITP